VDDQLAGLPDPEAGKAFDKPGEGVVGHCEQHKLGPLDDDGDFEDRHTGQEGFCAFPAGFRDRRNPDDGVSGGAQGSAEHGADLAGPDDAHPQAAGSA
jgi:hypothetical protein